MYMLLCCAAAGCPTWASSTYDPAAAGLCYPYARQRMLPCCQWCRLQPGCVAEHVDAQMCGAVLEQGAYIEQTPPQLYCMRCERVQPRCMRQDSRSKSAACTLTQIAALHLQTTHTTAVIAPSACIHASGIGRDLLDGTMVPAAHPTHPAYKPTPAADLEQLRLVRGLLLVQLPQHVGRCFG